MRPTLFGTVASGGAATGLIDLVSTPAKFAYSFRLLSSSYAGACAKVRASGSSDPYTDIEFVDGWFDVAAAQAVSATVEILFYDQSGNGYTQSKRVGQLLPIVAYNSLNSTPSVNWVSGGYQDIGDMSALTSGELFRVIKWATDPPSGGNIQKFGATDDYIPYSDGTIYDGTGSTTRKTTVNPATSMANWCLYSTYSAPSDWANYLNGTQLYTTASNTVAYDATPSTFFANGELSSAEAILFTGKLSAGDRATVFSNISTAYNLGF